MRSLRVAVLAASVVIAVLLAGCGGSSGSPQSGARQSPERMHPDQRATAEITALLAEHGPAHLLTEAEAASALGLEVESIGGSGYPLKLRDDPNDKTALLADAFYRSSGVLSYAEIKVSLHEGLESQISRIKADPGTYPPDVAEELIAVLKAQQNMTPEGAASEVNQGEFHGWIVEDTRRPSLGGVKTFAHNDDYDVEITLGYHTSDGAIEPEKATEVANLTRATKLVLDRFSAALPGLEKLREL